MRKEVKYKSRAYEYTLKMRKEKPERYNAMDRLHYAVRHGKIIKPDTCSINNDDCKGRIHAHHEDYSLPLEVIWLCQFHHIQRHMELKLEQDSIKSDFIEVELL